MGFDRQLEVLVLRCQIGDTDALQELFAKFHPRLRYYIRRLNTTHVGTDDLLQEIWLTVLRKIGGLRQPDAFTPWLYKIARNQIYGRFRQKMPFVELPEEELTAQTPSDDEDFSAEQARQIHKALNNIQPYHREVLTLYFLEKMPYETIAQIVGCTLGTVKSRIYYAKQALRKELETENE